MPRAEQLKRKPRLFRVRVEVTFVNGGCSKPIPIKVRAIDEDDVKRQVTPEYMIENVTDDWGVPIRNVTVLSAKPARSRTPSRRAAP